MDITSSNPSPDLTFMGVDREKIPWWPTIDLQDCDGCSGDYDCLKFCPHGVYKPLENSSRIAVENPYNCVVFCQACKKMCPKNAISFPSKRAILDLIKNERAK
ncbi:MAG: ferredoxin family protein [Candidatus Thorarchaeota archaeon]|nr:MAG: ferredoxin family protein [Candidatus Thorarchaeota archaeon]